MKMPHPSYLQWDIELTALQKVFCALTDARDLHKTKLLNNDSYCPMRKMPHLLCNQRDTGSTGLRDHSTNFLVQHLLVCHNTDLGVVQGMKGFQYCDSLPISLESFYPVFTSPAFASPADSVSDAVKKYLKSKTHQHRLKSPNHLTHFNPLLTPCASISIL